MCLGETFLNSDSQLNFPRFNLIRKDRLSHERSVAVLVREEVDVVQLTVHEADGQVANYKCPLHN